ncbi:MAG: helix-turn-helix domain-containing protein [Clostridiales bacterium]|nr:helix-turn-helix domain-containing protein [Clostridiales bacterium]
MEYPIYVKKMREFRAKANYTQQELSNLLSVQRQTYCNYENGIRMPPMEIMIRLTEIYSVSMDCLIRDRDARLLNKEQQFLLDGFSSLEANDRREILQAIHLKRKSAQKPMNIRKSLRPDTVSDSKKPS